MENLITKWKKLINNKDENESEILSTSNNNSSFNFKRVKLFKQRTI
jgi:hypothetical protein